MIKCELITKEEYENTNSDQLNILNFLVNNKGDYWCCKSDEGYITSIFKLFVNDNTCLYEGEKYKFTVTNKSEITNAIDVKNDKATVIPELLTQAIILGMGTI